jgi:hypothetical protein
MIETCNAVITGASLTIADHGVLSSFVSLSFSGGGQGFGGYALSVLEIPKGPNYAGIWIVRVLQIAGVTEWDQLRGKTVRIRHEHSKVHAIGHIIEEDWFDPSVVFARMEKGSEK